MANWTHLQSRSQEERFTPLLLCIAHRNEATGHVLEGSKDRGAAAKFSRTSSILLGISERNDGFRTLSSGFACCEWGWRW